MLKKKSRTTKMKRGNKYVCTQCGLVVSIDETCGCVDVCDIVCCGKPMKKKGKKAKK